MGEVQFESSCPYFNGTAYRDMYARIETLDTAMEAIKGKKEFIAKRMFSTSLYTGITTDTFFPLYILKNIKIICLSKFLE